MTIAMNKTGQGARTLMTGAILLTMMCGCRHNDDIMTDPADLASTLMGTDSEYLLSHGNTYPAVALPFGMNFWTPQTRSNGDGWA